MKNRKPFGKILNPIDAIIQKAIGKYKGEIKDKTTMRSTLSKKIEIKGIKRQRILSNSPKRNENNNLKHLDIVNTKSMFDEQPQSEEDVSIFTNTNINKNKNKPKIPKFKNSRNRDKRL